MFLFSLYAVTQTIVDFHPTQLPTGLDFGLIPVVQSMVEAVGFSTDHEIVACDNTETGIETESTNALVIDDPQMLHTLMTDGLDIAALLDAVIAGNSQCRPMPTPSHSYTAHDVTGVGLRGSPIVTAITPQQIRPFPAADRSVGSSKRKRASMKAQVVTSSPFKKELLAKKATKLPSSRKSQGKVAVPRSLLKDMPAPSPAKDLLRPRPASGRKGESKQQDKKSKNKTRKVKQVKATPRPTDKTNSSVDDVVCTGCGEIGGAEDWVQCNACASWWHEACSAYSGGGEFICDLC